MTTFWNKHDYGEIILALGIICIAANLRAAITAVGPLIELISKDTNISNGEAGLLTTIPLIAFAFFSPFAPRLAQLCGLNVTLGTSMLLLTLGIFLRSTPSVTNLFLGTIMIGLSISVGNVLIPSFIKLNFPRRIGSMTGLYSISMGIWAALAAGLSPRFLEYFHLTWRGSLAVWAILSLFALFIWLPQMRLSHTSNPTPNYVSFFEIMHSQTTWYVAFFMGLQSLLFYVIIAWLPQILHEAGMTLNQAGSMSALLNFIGIPVSVIVPIWASRYKDQRTIVLIVFIIYLIGLAGIFFNFTQWAIVWVVLLGIGQGSTISLALTLITLRASNASSVAQLSGASQSIGYMLAAVGPVSFGFLRDLTGSWHHSIAVLILVSIAMLYAGLGAAKNTNI